VGRVARDLRFKSRPGGEPVKLTVPIDFRRGAEAR
jgi:hypothetical protein